MTNKYYHDQDVIDWAKVPAHINFVAMDKNKTITGFSLDTIHSSNGDLWTSYYHKCKELTLPENILIDADNYYKADWKKSVVCRDSSYYNMRMKGIELNMLVEKLAGISTDPYCAVSTLEFLIEQGYITVNMEKLK